MVDAEQKIHIGAYEFCPFFISCNWGTFHEFLGIPLPLLVGKGGGAGKSRLGPSCKKL